VYVQRFIFLGAELFFGVGLMFAEKFRLETDIAWFVHTMDVSESSGDREVWSNFRKSLIHIPDILWLGIQGSIIHAGVVDTYPRQQMEKFAALPSSSPPVIPISISSHCFMGTARLKYFWVNSMFSSFDSSERSTMWELR
jgi:hypothetical protein